MINNKLFRFFVMALLLGLFSYSLYFMLNIFFVFLVFVIFFWFTNLEFFFTISLKIRKFLMFAVNDPFKFGPATVTILEAKKLSAKDFVAEIFYLASKKIITLKQIKLRSSKHPFKKDLEITFGEKAVNFNYQGLPASQSILTEWLKKYSTYNKLSLTKLISSLENDDSLSKRFNDWKAAVYSESAIHVKALSGLFAYFFGITIFSLIAVIFVFQNVVVFPVDLNTAIIFTLIICFSEALFLWLAFPQLVPRKNLAQAIWIEKFKLFRAFINSNEFKQSNYIENYCALALSLDEDFPAFQTLSQKMRISKTSYFGELDSNFDYVDFLRLLDNFEADFDNALNKPSKPKK